MKCKAPAARRARPGAVSAVPPSPPSLREETLLLRVLCCHCAELVLNEDRLQLPGSSPQCCPAFVGRWCGKITQPPVALAVSSAVTTTVLRLLLLVVFFLYTELPRFLLLKWPSGMDCGSVKTHIQAAALEEPVRINGNQNPSRD